MVRNAVTDEGYIALVQTAVCKEIRKVGLKLVFRIGVIDEGLASRQPLGVSRRGITCEDDAVHGILGSLRGSYSGVLGIRPHAHDDAALLRLPDGGLQLVAPVTRVFVGFILGYSLRPNHRSQR